MPPNFQQEGIDAAKEIRKRHPGTGIVILSQYDDPDYAISLLSEGAAGYAYLLKDRIAEGDQLARAIREVATGGSMLDPVIVSALRQPGAHGRGGLTRRGRRPARRWSPPGKHHQGHRRGPPHHAGRRRRGASSACSVRLAEGVSSGADGRPRAAAPAARGHRRAGGAGRDAEPAAARRRRREAARASGRGIGETERLEVTVLM